MKKLWTFGDSFTQGFGLAKPYAGYWYKDKFEKFIFPAQLAKRLGCTLENWGTGGFSNMSIMSALIHCLPSISSGDTVVVGLTTSDRYRIEVDGKGMEISAGTVDNIYSSFITGDGQIEEGSNLYNLLKSYSKEELISIFHYYMVQFPNKADAYEKHYVDLFLSLQQALLNRGVNTVIWRSEVWGCGENIIDWTSGLKEFEVNDGHWSPNGHNTFTEIIHHAVLNNDGYVDLGYVESFKQNISTESPHGYIKPL